MSKLVIFRIEAGNFEQGFPVNLEIRDTGKLCVPEVTGFLVGAPNVPARYTEWQQAYYAWGEDANCRWWGRSNSVNNQVNPENSLRQIQVPPQTNSNYSSGNSGDQAKTAALNLEKDFNDWLDHSSLEDIKETLLHTVRSDETVRFIVQTNNLELQKLPWKLWRLLGKWYGDSEVALSTRKAPEKGSLRLPVKILVILGNDENIDIKTDWNILQKRLSTAKLTLLKKPRSEEVREQLKNIHWDVVFFAGHSSTEPGGTDARIWINEQEYLSPQQLKTALRTAVKHGLKLAIFNSCDGLGLARQLENLQIPHIIVMREPIHDEVAQKFLDYFLTSFAEGASLHEAVGEARDQLRLIENQSPNASWLPVIFQNPEESPLLYPRKELLSELVENSSTNSKTKQKIKKYTWWGIGAIALITLAFVIYKIIDLSKDSTLAPGISLGEEILSQNSTPEKQAGVKAFKDKNYSVAITNFKASLQKNPNDPEARIYLNNAKVANNKETIKIAVSVPFGGNQTIAEEILRGVAEVQDEINRDIGINGKSLQVVIANDNNDSTRAEEVARKFVKDTTLQAVVGHNSSNASIAAAPIYKQGKLVMVSPTSFANNLQESSYIFRMVPQITFFAAQLSNGLGRAISNPKVAVCVDTDVSPDQEDFRTQFKYVVSAYKGHNIELSCDLSESNFNPNTIVEVIRKNNVNSLMIAPYVNNLPKAIGIFKALQENQSPMKLFGSPTLYTEQTIKLGGRSVEGLTLSVPYYPDEREKNSFRELWKTELNTWRSPLAKDATKAIVTGLEQLLKQPQPNRQELDNILRNPNFKVKGVTGEFNFDKNVGERKFMFQPKRTDALIQIQSGKFVKIE
ncbi:ABC transporter substrate-binding protein [Fischerella sp. PCC 9605]|uniref:ABC transporter substrate-binding protein n=1 Tax=Fischerella sp. PCC 9605 TaxID=1173024 RepID=UPI00047922A3|nr:ABC transporter substrate-binding protein [Fischerella sp. PCC 9605]